MIIDKEIWETIGHWQLMWEKAPIKNVYIYLSIYLCITFNC